jgi:hypothetical protein
VIAFFNHGGTDFLEVTHGSAVSPEVGSCGAIPGIEAHQEIPGKLEFRTLDVIAVDVSVAVVIDTVVADLDTGCRLSAVIVGAIDTAVTIIVGPVVTDLGAGRTLGVSAVDSAIVIVIDAVVADFRHQRNHL